jgi:hypothetical protein
LKVCSYPNFMNDSLQYVRPVLSLDATHLKSQQKGTLYLVTVNTGLYDIYAIAIGETHALYWHRITQKNYTGIMVIIHLFRIETKV